MNKMNRRHFFGGLTAGIAGVGFGKFVNAETDKESGLSSGGYSQSERGKKNIPITPVTIETKKFGIWVHGSITRVSFPERLAPTEPQTGSAHIISGSGIEFYSKEKSTNWFHIPITIPVFIDNVRPTLEKIFVFFKTTGRVFITHWQIYDGPNKVHETRLIDTYGMNSSGDHSTKIDSSNTIIPRENITIYYGLCISLGVSFEAKPSNYPFPSILFTTAGADFKMTHIKKMKTKKTR